MEKEAMMALLELQVDEIFTIDEGFAAIEEELEKHKSIELINIPLDLVRKWKPLLQGKKVTLYNNLPDGLPPDIQDFVSEVFTTVQMKGTLYGREVAKGEIFVKNRIFNIWYADGEILNIGSVTYRRCVKCIQAMHRDIMLQEKMDVLNIMTLYDPEKGEEAIINAVEKSFRIRMVNLPKFLVRKIVVYVNSDDVKILCAQMSDQARQVSRDHYARVSGGLLNVYSRYKGTKVKSGGVALDDSFFSVNYTDDKIYSILGIEWPRCPACMTDFYELGWRAASKIK
jgi:hypothetical protein